MTITTRKALGALSVALGLPLAAAGAAREADTGPHSLPDASLVTLSGTVAAPEDDGFDLDYGSGTIRIEMHGWDSYNKARALMDGDSVTVYGRTGDDFFERGSIEAGAVYVDQLNSYFYASSADRRAAAYRPDLWVAPRLTPVSEITLRGQITAVDRDDRSFTLRAGGDDIEVETHLLGYNPVDDKGFQRIDRGDWVSVSGTLDWQLIDARVMSAGSLTTLVDDAA